jgi:transcriptional regulator with XRE-family HTH domain
MKLTPKQLKRLRGADWDGNNKIRLAMTLAGLTQVELGELMGIPQSQVSKDINKTQRVTLAKSRIYARFFGCAIDDLFAASEEEALAS